MISFQEENSLKVGIQLSRNIWNEGMEWQGNTGGLGGDVKKQGNDGSEETGADGVSRIEGKNVECITNGWDTFIRMELNNLWLDLMWLEYIINFEYFISREIAFYGALLEIYFTNSLRKTNDAFAENTSRAVRGIQWRQTITLVKGTMRPLISWLLLLPKFGGKCQATCQIVTRTHWWTPIYV